MCYVTWTCEIHPITVCINVLKFCLVLEDLLIIHFCYIFVDVHWKLQLPRTPQVWEWLFCYGDCGGQGSAYGSVYQCVWKCPPQQEKKGFQSPQHRNSTSRRKPSRPVSASVHKPFNLLFLLLWTEESCHDWTKNHEWCCIDVHDLEILCCCEMLMSKYYTIPRKGRCIINSA